MVEIASVLPRAVFVGTELVAEKTTLRDLLVAERRRSLDAR